MVSKPTTLYTQFSESKVLKIFNLQDWWTGVWIYSSFKFFSPQWKHKKSLWTCIWIWILVSLLPPQPPRKKPNRHACWVYELRPQNSGENPCQSLLRSGFCSVLIPHILLILESISILKLVLKKTRVWSVAYMPVLHRLEGWDLELRVPKRGLMGSSRGKREISGKKE